MGGQGQQTKVPTFIQDTGKGLSIESFQKDGFKIMGKQPVKQVD
jgi:hypothetical protein